MNFIKNTIEKIKNLDRKKLFAGIFAGVLLIALPVTIFTIQNRQNIASQAGNPVTVTLQPTSGNIVLNQTLDVQVVLKAGAISVQTAEFTISYGQPGQTDKITAEFTPNPNSGFTALYTPPVETNTSAKSITYKTAVNVGTANISGDVVLGTLKLRGVSAGAAEVRFSGGAFNELSGELTPTFINGNYTVAASTPATATPVTNLPGGALKNITTNVYSPSTTNTGNGAVWQVGYRFKPLSNGSITQLWCYRKSGKVTLWNDVGNKLAEAQVTCPTNGWGFANITPIPVAVGTYYRVSLLTNSFYLVKPFTQNTQTSGIEINGGYYAGSDSFPTTNGNNSYGIPGVPDVTFVQGAISNTPIPATSTPVPATSTPIPATSTPIPATNTPIPVMSATTISATSIQQTSATLRGSINAAGLSSKVYFRYSTTNDACQALTTKSAESSYTASSSTRTVTRSITGLQPNTIYHYCVVVEQTGSANPQIARGTVSTFRTSNLVSTNTPVPATNTPIPATNTPVASTNSPIPATNTPIPATATPLPSPNNSQAKLAIAVKLPGIGTNNNGQSPSLGENNNPSTQRAFDVALYDSQANPVGSPRSTQFVYSPTDGSYKGEVLLSGIPFNSVYEIKIKTDNSLQKRLGFVEELEAGKTITINANNPANEIVTGKVNLTTPNLIGLQDYNDFMKCFRKLSTCTAAMKARADFTDDEKVDLKDLNILLSAFANRQGD
ncbi:MAG: DUF4082 domain-containing protein [Candidatus Levybacteria bacterium]|nr:DUF4082 domain-containing protein [Candidatus Levybacteria bacterium]